MWCSRRISTSTCGVGRVPVVEPAPQASACGALGCSEGPPFYRVEHPEKGERVLCEGHVRPLAASVSSRRRGRGFKSSEEDRSSSTETRTGRSSVGSEAGRKTPPQCCQSMTANESTPAQGESPNGVSVPECTVSRAVDVEVPKEIVDEARRRRARARASGCDVGSLQEWVADHVELSLVFVEDGAAAGELKSERLDGGVTPE